MTLRDKAPVESAVTRHLREAAGKMAFEMSCSPLTGALLTVLAASKPMGRLLELGTGVGVGTSYLTAGLVQSASLVTVEIDAKLQEIAKQHLADTPNLTFINDDAAEFLLTCSDRFDLIFADTWAGKFTHLIEALNLLQVGGIYVIDDLLPQPNWATDHAPKVPQLLSDLSDFAGLRRVEMDWDTGLAIYVRTSRDRLSKMPDF
jgi:predicted O-methyltransferase YrrM